MQSVGVQKAAVTNASFFGGYNYSLGHYSDCLQGISKTFASFSQDEVEVQTVPQALDKSQQQVLISTIEPQIDQPEIVLEIPDKTDDSNDTLSDVLEPSPRMALPPQISSVM